MTLTPRLSLGTSEDGPIFVNVDCLVETRMLITATSGAGKSWTLRRLLEQTHGKIQQIVIDPEDEFQTLREKFAYVLAGKGGDCPADVRGAALLATKLLELGVSAIIGLYELPPLERIQFVKLFLDSMVDAPKKLWHPCMVVLDEAHMFAPQANKSKKSQSVSRLAVENLMSRGRKRGFVGVLATQRYAKLDSDCASMCQNVVVGKFTLDIDVDRAVDALGFRGRDAGERVKVLKPGEFYCYGPALVDTVTLMKVGPVTTTHPKAGDRAIAVTPPPQATITKVLAELANLPAEAKAKAQTEAELRARIVELERGVVIVAEDKDQLRNEAYQSGLGDGMAGGTREYAIAIRSRVEQLVHSASTRAAAAFGEELNRFFAEQDHLLMHNKAVVMHPSAPAMRKPPAKLDTTQTRPAPSPRPNGLPSGLRAGGMRRMMIALAQRNGLSAVQLGVRAGLSSSSGTFTTYLGKLRSEGWIEGGRDRLSITPAGLDALGHYEPLPTGRELLAYWLQELGSGGQSRMLAHLANNQKAMTAEELGGLSNISSTSGTFTTYLGKLRKLELITGDRSALRASEELF